MRLRYRIPLALVSSQGVAWGTFLMIRHLNDVPRGYGLLGYAGLIMALVGCVGLVWSLDPGAR